MIRRIRSRSVALALLVAFALELLRPLPAQAPTFVTLTATTLPAAGQRSGLDRPRCYDDPRLP